MGTDWTEAANAALPMCDCGEPPSRAPYPTRCQKCGGWGAGRWTQKLFHRALRVALRDTPGPREHGRIRVFCGSCGKPVWLFLHGRKRCSCGFVVQVRRIRRSALIDEREVAQLCNAHRDTVLRWFRRGLMPAPVLHQSAVCRGTHASTRRQRLLWWSSDIAIWMAQRPERIPKGYRYTAATEQERGEQQHSRATALATHDPTEVRDRLLDALDNDSVSEEHKVQIRDLLGLSQPKGTDNE